MPKKRTKTYNNSYGIDFFYDTVRSIKKYLHSFYHCSPK